MLQHHGEATDRIEADGRPGLEGSYRCVQAHALQAEAGAECENADHAALRVADRNRRRRKRTVLMALLQRFALMHNANPSSPCHSARTTSRMDNVRRMYIPIS